ncbi:hypothetical protein G5C60_32555 [Streptomyces sp. HC44]|uniref:Uncharacterized protein n=1 Tax=Streptomyces scabichelini TaxID=2711217 RepID=A0A6G4VE10_9ACTN|nr:hypothetical protein [Streptomyces scabichelini]NGO12211.1 hypothetical protein [Streptomyces scabichelini]
MLLWDQEMRSARSEISELAPSLRLTVAVKTIEQTLTALQPPLSDSPASRIISDSLRVCQEAIESGTYFPAVPENLEEAVGNAIDDGPEPGATPLLMAVVNCFGHPEPGMGTEELFTVLSDCYQAVLEREQIEVVTPEAERQNLRCREAIRVQKEILNAARGNS